jgi:hypothetical protein
MAKTEGGIGLEQGIVNFERIASEIHFLANATQITQSSLNLPIEPISAPETRASISQVEIQTEEENESFNH